MTENELRQKVADIINAWVGATKGSAKHLEILEIYNTHRPLARGYAVKKTDAYCATTVSAAYIKAGIAEYTGTECGVEKYTLVAKKLGVRHTIARVRNPEYEKQLRFMRDELGLSMAINPEKATAREISRVLRFPSALKVDTFAKGRIELV